MAQLIWREFFYTMSVNNEFYAEMERNEICINIPWYNIFHLQRRLFITKKALINILRYSIDGNPEWQAFQDAKTGYPFIDAGIRQMRVEGWIHHVVRNAIASFLTRGDLWISWEEGLHLFFKYLLDADWSVCAGNWMWISSSAFEQVIKTQKELFMYLFIGSFNWTLDLKLSLIYTMKFSPKGSELPQLRGSQDLWPPCRPMGRVC